MVAQASHELESSPSSSTPPRCAGRQEAAVAEAQQAAASAQEQLEALDGQIRQIARTAYTSDGLSQIDALTSNSAEDFVSQLGTLDAIAGHTSDVLANVSAAADAAAVAQTEADAAPRRRRRRTTRSPRSKPTWKRRSPTTRRSSTR